MNPDHILLAIGVVLLIAWTVFNLIEIRKTPRRQYGITKCVDGFGREIWSVKKDVCGEWQLTQKEFSSLALAQDHVRYLEECDLKAKRIFIAEEPITGEATDGKAI